MEEPNLLSRLRMEYPDIAQILDRYSEAESIYRDSLKAMGRITASSFQSGSSADVAVSLQPAQSLSTDKWRS